MRISDWSSDVCSSDLEEAVGGARTMGAVIECSATMNEPGIIHRHTPVSRSWFAVGALPGGPADRAGEIADLLRHAGTVALVDDIEAAQWTKLDRTSTCLNYSH